MLILFTMRSPKLRACDAYVISAFSLFVPLSNWHTNVKWKQLHKMLACDSLVEELMKTTIRLNPLGICPPILTANFLQ